MTTVNTLYGPVEGYQDTLPAYQGRSSDNHQQQCGGEASVSKWLWERTLVWVVPNPMQYVCAKGKPSPRFPQGLTVTDLIFGHKEELVEHGCPVDESEQLGFNLNVFAPSHPPHTQRLPVLVWIYGGSLEGGSADSIIYDPTEWIRREAKEGRDFMVVSGNYRCNMFGFMACEDLARQDPEGLAGNYGVYDCIAMLQWVQENISNFGGDPDNVTVFGESAGAFLIGTLLVTQQKLFQRAILQSGAPQSMTQRSVDCHVNQEYFASLLEYFNVPQELTSQQRIAFLREIPTGKLVEFVKARGSIINDYGLAIEPSSKSSTWHRPTIDLIKEKRWNPHLKSLLMGHTQDEGSIFAFFFQTQTREGYENVLRRKCPFSPPSEINQLYPSPQELQDPSIDWTTCVGSRLVHDQVIETPMENLALALDGAKHHLTGEPCQVYFYHLDERLPSIDQGLKWGAFHTIDLPLVFNVNSLWEPGSDQAKTSAAMGSLWINFAQTGTPDATWSVYSPSTSPFKFLIGKGGHVSTQDTRSSATHSQQELHKRRIEFWIGQLESIVSLEQTVGRNDVEST